MQKIVIVGAGIGGLTAAGVLAKAGLDVTVLEAHVYPGGCAGTFYHQGFRFDAGATLAGGFYPGGPMDKIAQLLGIQWPTNPEDLSMVVHLPDGSSVKRYGSEKRWQERERQFGPSSLKFWQWQERTADAMWDMALRTPTWPPQSLEQGARLVLDGLSWAGSNLRDHLQPSLLADALRPLSSHLNGASEKMRLFVDAQLLISAQATSSFANSLYGASALDLPRRGVVHLEGGMGTIAQKLVQAVEDHGGKVYYRQEVTQVRSEKNHPVSIETKRGESFSADLVLFNLPPWNIARLLEADLPARLRNLPERPQAGWGAFMAYIGLDDALIPKDFPLHHQVIINRPLGEANTVFASLSPQWDLNRAPLGQRALTLSTHTDLNSWWDLFEEDRESYTARKEIYTSRLLAAIERILPGTREGAELVLPGTPVTFQRFTRRDWGWVGGFPQTSLFRVWGPKLSSKYWMVGDSIFPGQSTAAVALGGMRVAKQMLKEMRIRLPVGSQKDQISQIGTIDPVEKIKVAPVRSYLHHIREDKSP